MRRACHPCAWLLMLTIVGSAAEAQAPKAGAGGSHRTLTGKLGAVKDGGKALIIDVAEGAAKSWTLGVGKQTLLMTANKNGQFSRLDPADLKKGEVVQAVVDLGADEAGSSHKVWWLIVYPAGTAPPAP